MKRKILVLVMAAFATLAFANGPVDFGLNLRYSAPRTQFEVLKLNEVSDLLRDSEHGYDLGLFLRLNVNRCFVHTEAMFAYKKLTFEGIANRVQDKFTGNVMKTRTVEVPVFFGVNIINKDAFKIKAFTGPTFNWLMGYDAGDSGIFDADPTNFNWLWSVGAGVEVLFLSFDVRYGFDVNGRTFEGMQDSFKQKTNMLAFTLGWRMF